MFHVKHKSMIKEIAKRIGLVLGIMIIIALLFSHLHSVRELIEELKTSKENVHIISTEATYYKMRDSIEVAEKQALILDADEFKKLAEERAKEIEALKNSKKKELEDDSEVLKKDTVVLTHIDTIFIDADTCFEYRDEYTTALFCPLYSRIAIRDTIKQTISKEYKHKFLFFKWKCIGVKQDIWSSNPHSHIEFDNFVKFE